MSVICKLLFSDTFKKECEGNLNCLKTVQTFSDTYCIIHIAYMRDLVTPSNFFADFKKKGNLQSFSCSIEQGLTERLILWNGLKNVSVISHIADGPLTQTCTTQSKDVTETI